MLILGENRYLSGDLMRFLYRLTELTARTRKACKRALRRLEVECLQGTVAYAPKTAFPYSGQITLLRNPHIARNEEAVVGLLEEEGSLRRRYLSHLSYVVMVDARTLIPERLGGADYDGDIVKLIADPLLNECVRRNYTNQDTMLLDYRRNLPLLKIPSVSARESESPPGNRMPTTGEPALKRFGTPSPPGSGRSATPPSTGRWSHTTKLCRKQIE